MRNSEWLNQFNAQSGSIIGCLEALRDHAVRRVNEAEWVPIVLDPNITIAELLDVLLLYFGSETGITDVIRISVEETIVISESTLPGGAGSGALLGMMDAARVVLEYLIPEGPTINVTVGDIIDIFDESPLQKGEMNLLGDFAQVILEKAPEVGTIINVQAPPDYIKIIQSSNTPGIGNVAGLGDSAYCFIE